MPEERWIARTPLDQQIRLSEAAWTKKLLISHPEFSQHPNYEQELRLTLEDPEFIVEGWEGAWISLRWCAIAPKGAKYLCAVYREAKPVGFVITAFFISRYGKLLKRDIQWKKHP